MTINHRLWTELWARAARSEMGIAVVAEPANYTKDYIVKNRPDDFKNYVVALTSDPNLLFIIKPGVTLDQELPE